MKKIYSLLKILFFLALLVIGSPQQSQAQSGTDFWFAPPYVTHLHNPPGGKPIYLLLSSMGAASTVTVSIPANVGFTPIVVTIPASKSKRIDLSAFQASLETTPTNAVLNTGLRIQATTPITANYEEDNTNNPEDFALKGANALGTEFYIPLTIFAPYHNEASFGAPNQAIASFDIVATQNGTTVLIYSPVPVDGHPALTQFSITLNAGQTYSCGWSGANWTLPSTHPAGAAVLSDKPIAVTVKDDSNHNASGGCYDLIGDQIIPVNILGTDYVAVKGFLNNGGNESVFITATQNNTSIYLDGNVTPIITMFAGETFRIDMDSLPTAADNSIYVKASNPVYATHVTGFGCEMGSAILPPLNCAGSHQVNFMRSTNEAFYLTLLVHTTAINNFTITGPGTATITPASFVTVPGTAGLWKAARIQYTLLDIPVDSGFSVTNSSDVFALGIINGGAATGCRYGYFSEFVAPIVVNAGADQNVCANDTAQLSGSVTGGSTSGIWTTSGSGAFLPNNTTANAQYAPSPADIALTTVTLTLTSTSICFPQQDQMVIHFTPAPTVNAGGNQTVCKNNPSITLNGSVTVATGGLWSGGAGTFTPNNTTLNALYTPTAAELAAGTLVLTLTSIGNGTCHAVSNSSIITFSPSPTVNAGPDQTLCVNNPGATLAGSVTVAGGGIWSGGAGSFSPNNTTMNAVYSPTGAEISSGNLTLTLSSTANGTCNAVTDQMNIIFSAPPTVNAGADQTVCANNANVILNGTVTLSTGGQWTGGLGTFLPNNNTLNATYTPTASEIASGNVALTLTTTGNGMCNAVTDQMVIFFTATPTISAGINQTVCKNNPAVVLNGSVSIASGAIWSGGTGTFNPNNTTLNATYTPGASEIAAGTATLTLTSTGNGTCIAVSSSMVITLTPSPVVNAGPNQILCGNNPNATLSGSVSFAGGGIWSGGAGSFSPSNTALNAIYTPTPAEIGSGSVTLILTSTSNGTCNAVSGQIQINFTLPPTVNAGADRSVCANNATVTLNGSISIAAGAQWSGGLGTFAPNNSTLNAAYSPTAGEIAAGNVVLTLTTTGNGNCNAVNDQMQIFFTPAPTVSAGSNQIVCDNNASSTLNGSFTGASGILWSGGSGTYNPNNTTTNAVYTPSAAEKAAGTATLKLTTTGNGTCLSVSDSIVITILPKPIVNAGSDQTVCVTNLFVQMSGSISGSTNTGQWTSLGTGTFIPNNTALNASYHCSNQDSLNGFVKLVLTSTNNGACLAVTDTVKINILPAGGANAGSNVTVCGNNATVLLNGTITGGASSGTWTSNGTGVFNPNNTNLNAQYIPSAGDVASGSVTLTLTANSCNPAISTMQITITPAPSVNAGSDQTVCSSIHTISLNGSVTGGTTTGIWSSSGTGSFIPNNTTLNATYQLSSADSAAQVIYLVLHSTNNGSCVSVTDTVMINIFPVSTVNAGTDQTVCANNPAVNLNGFVSGSGPGMWSTSGSGVFNPNVNTLNATYTPSAADIAVGQVNLILSATSSCNLAVDFMVVYISPAPTSNAGPDQSVCGSNPTVSLAGSVVSAAGGIWSGGNGTYNPSTTSLNATYTPTIAEISSGTLTLILTTTGNGICNAVTDAIVINFTSSIVANAGVDQHVCRSAPNAQMQGIISNGSSSGIWSTLGSGTFLPNDSALNALYQFSTADTSAGSVTLVLTSTHNGMCAPAIDTMKIIFGLSAFAYAGVDQNTCSTNTVINLNGLVSGGASTGQWSTMGSGSFTPNPQTLNGSYVLSAGDISNGSVNLILSTTNSGGCLTGTDTMLITIDKPANVNAGTDQTVCFSTAFTLLSGTVSGGSTTGQWTTLGSGTFSPNSQTLNASYTFSAADYSSGTIKLVLESTNNGACGKSSDTVLITITAATIVNAGADQSICSSTLVQLNGSVQGGSSTGIWNTLGSGTFNPNANALNATYTPSASDITNGIVKLTLSSTNNGACNTIIDTVIIRISSAAVANAGMDQSICPGGAIQLNGIINGGSGTGIWISMGTGSFVPNTSTLNASYVPSQADHNAGNIELVLVSTNNGQCSVSSDTMKITFGSKPVAAFTSTVTGSTASFSDQSLGAITWLWDFGNSGGSSTQQNPSYTYAASGTYTVSLIVTNTLGCTDTAHADVIIESTTVVVSPVAVPTGFTPNGDNVNDGVMVLGGPFLEVELKIYNQWGNLVFSSDAPKGTWDGKLNGTDQPAGVYIFTAKGKTVDGKEFNFSGDVTLIR